MGNILKPKVVQPKFIPPPEVVKTGPVHKFFDFINGCKKLGECPKITNPGYLNIFGSATCGILAVGVVGINFYDDYQTFKKDGDIMNFMKSIITTGCTVVGVVIGGQVGPIGIGYGAFAGSIVGTAAGIGFNYLRKGVDKVGSIISAIKGWF
jgi:hypothetical protein